MKPCPDVNTGREERHGDKDVLLFPVGTEIGVLSLDFHNCIILRFHFLYPFKLFTYQPLVVKACEVVGNAGSILV